MRRRYALLIFYFILQMFFLFDIGLCGTDPEPFSQIEAEIHGAVNINREDLHQFWEPRTGAGLSLQTPFYTGEARISIHYIPYQTKNSSYPDFYSISYLLAWGKNIINNKRIKIFAAPQIGSFATIFKEDQLAYGQKEISESEFGFGANISLSLFLTRNWTLRSSYEYLTIYSHKKIHLSILTIGVSRIFNTPKWLREILY